MKAILRYTLVLLPSLALVSCSNWLDVAPKSEVDQRDMFKNADGYYAALTGIYITMADSTLYGGRLPLHLNEALTQQYFISAYDISREKWALNHDYKVAQFETVISKLWLNMYNSIANCNLLLSNIHNEKRRLFEDGVLEVMLGETLGLRACLYFDLARMFNESYAANPAADNVPYKTDFGLTIGQKLTSGQLLANVVTDLREAQTLLFADDPAVSGRQYRDKYVSYTRNQRMNYYAVTALLARVHIYMGDYGDAYRCATEVIGSGYCRFIRENEIVVTDPYGKEIKIDRIFSPEQIFGLRTDNIVSIARTWYEGYTGDLLRSLNCYDANDIRRGAWHVTNSIRGYNMIKYKRSKLAGEQHIYGDPIAPVLRLGEMYLIAAEAAMMDPSTGGDAVALLNEFKSNRNAATLTGAQSPDAIRREITREYICEFRGEGQLFWYYKRNNMTAVDNGNYLGTTVEIPAAAFTFPLPQYEIDYGTGK